MSVLRGERRCLRAAAVAVLLCGLLGPATVRAVPADTGLDELVRTFGLGWVIERFAPQINEAINETLRQQGAEVAGATRVVPVVRAGGGGQAVGAAQVAGPAVQVDQVEAVAEVPLAIAGTLRSRGLLPVSSREATRPEAVAGVAVSACIRLPR